MRNMQERGTEYYIILVDGRCVAACRASCAIAPAVRARVRVVTARRVPRQQRMNIMSFGVHGREHMTDDVST
jgi:hypothetical protein